MSLSTLLMEVFSNVEEKQSPKERTKREPREFTFSKEDIEDRYQKIAVFAILQLLRYSSRQ